jgi:hypothetical protein
MYAGEARKEGAVNDYFLQEMVRIRMDELREEAARAREGRGSGGTTSVSWAYLALPAWKAAASPVGR